MYRSEICRALERLKLAPGGAVDGLLHCIQSVEATFESGLAEVAANNDSAIKTGVAHLHQAIGPINKRLAEISPSATAVELHELGKRFDAVLKDYPALESLLRPGRQAVAALAGAFDLVLQQSRGAPAVMRLIFPSRAVATCYAHYGAIANVLTQPVDEREGAESATIEIEGAQRLEAFANYTALLSYLAGSAALLIEEGDTLLPHPERDIWIESIESGSPIQIKLFGDGKTLRLLLTMLRDLIRVPYLYLSAHGQALQAMETFAHAKELGIDSPAVLGKLQDAMVEATGKYANALRSSGVVVSVDGKPVLETSAQMLPAPEIDFVTNESGTPKLSGPKK